MADSSPGPAAGYRDEAGVSALLQGRGSRRRERDPDAERAILAGLAQDLADDPAALMQALAEAARKLCGASAVVVAVREAGSDGEQVCWSAASGTVAGQAGKRFAIDACPCGICVRQNGALLFAHPAQAFDAVRAAGVAVGEALGVPWRVRGHPAGALLAMLDDDDGFDAHDLRLLRELAGFAAAAHRADCALRGRPDPELLERGLEQRLRPVLESERRYRMLFEAMDQGFLLAALQYDGDGRAAALGYLEANPAAVRMTSIHTAGPGQLKMRAGHEPCWLEACAQVVRSGVGTRSQCFAGALNSWFDFAVYPVGGDTPRVAILFHDITVRKRAEDALRESEARFRALADASPAVIYQFEPDGELMYLNQRVPGAVGAAGEADCWRASVRPDHMQAYLAEVSEGIRQRAACTQRVRVPALDGGWRWFESHAAPWHSGDGRHRGYVGISLDISAAVQAEQTLKDADRRKDEFLATLAHELRNPLAPISNAVQLLRRPDGRRQADRVVEMIGRQVGQIVRLVDDLLEVSRIARGKIDLRLERVPLADVIHAAVETSQLPIERAGHQLAVALPEDGPVLLADRVRLTQVFANLLNNAAKYTDEGGRIWLEAGYEDGQARVSVRDTGIGIPAGSLGRVFEMFAQAHRAVGRGQGGLGIGLTMVRSLVEMHHGSVEAHSGGTGLGSEFVVRLPLAPQEDGRADAPGNLEARPHAPFAGQRILVVDDNRDAADTLGLLVEADGAEVRVVYDGRSALAMAESFLPTSVLLDIGMPLMDGYEVARRMRQDERFASMRIVALTGWGQDADRRQTRNRGFTHHLTKPVSVEDLQRILVG